MTNYRFNKDKFKKEFESAMQKEASPQVQNFFEDLTDFLVYVYEKGLKGEKLSDVFTYLEEVSPGRE